MQNPNIYNQGRFGNGTLASGHEGLPHMARADFTGEYPFARVRLGDRSDLPGPHQHKAIVAVVLPLNGQQADCAWFRSGWWDGLIILCNQLLSAQLQTNSLSPPTSDDRQIRFGASLFWNLTLKPGESRDIPLFYCRHAPNSDLRQSCAEDADNTGGLHSGHPGMARTYRPWYATRPRR